MLSSIRKAQVLIPFFTRRLGDYAELARHDLIAFRNEMVAAIIGAAFGVAASLLLLGFICVALIITEWDTPYRVRTAWLIVLAWSLVAAVCGRLARFLMKGSSPFANIAEEVRLDLHAIKDPMPAVHE